MSKDIKRFPGTYLVFRLKPKGITKRLGGKSMPWFRHPTLEAAESEACRLNDQFPDSTFVVMQEVSRIKRAAEIREAA